MRLRTDMSPTGRPRMRAWPPVGKISCISSFSVVLLPTPFGPTSKVPFWSVLLKAGWVAALLAGTLLAIGLALAAHWRRTPAGLAWGTVAAVMPLPVMLALFAVAAGLPPARSIATFAAATPLSVAVAAVTVAIPLAGLWLGFRALRSRRAGPATRIVAGTVALLLLVASAWLAGWGWIGLRTWTL